MSKYAGQQWKNNGFLFDVDHTPYEKRLKRKNITNDKAKAAFKHKPYQLGDNNGRIDNKNG